MTPALLLDLVTPAAVAKAILGAAIGAGIGALHFQALWWSLRAGDGAARFVARTALRWSLTIGLFGALALLGAPALLGGALGLLAARHIVLRKIGRLP
ncbi:MAG: N-ATPase, AtpR subunit [Proteobacteria bacterium]|nr:N-ATPase, AtpR subunit [Pseudomonadota bacterium]